MIQASAKPELQEDHDGTAVKSAVILIHLQEEMMQNQDQMSMGKSGSTDLKWWVLAEGKSVFISFFAFQTISYFK